MPDTTQPGRCCRPSEPRDCCRAALNGSGGRSLARVSAPRLDVNIFMNGFGASCRLQGGWGEGHVPHEWEVVAAARSARPGSAALGAERRVPHWGAGGDAPSIAPSIAHARF